MEAEENFSELIIILIDILVLQIDLYNSAGTLRMVY